MKNRFATALVRTVSKIPVKIRVSMCIFVYALVMAMVKSRSDGIWCLIAVLFCLTGDVALNHKKDRHRQTSKDFEVGMFMFMMAHICYTITYLVLMHREYSQAFEHGYNWLLFILCDCFLFVGIFEPLTERVNLGKYEIAIMVYTMVIVTSFTTTFFYANCVKSIASTACIGAALMVLSDLIIAFEKFGHYENHSTRRLVWITYVAGQFLMITFA